MVSAAVAATVAAVGVSVSVVVVVGCVCGCGFGCDVASVDTVVVVGFEVTVVDSTIDGSGCGDDGGGGCEAVFGILSTTIVAASADDSVIGSATDFEAVNSSTTARDKME